MKYRLSLLTVCVLLISGCSSNQNAAESDIGESVNQVSPNWLETKSDEISAEGKAAFDSLVPDYDEFENTGYLDLPKNAQPKLALGKTNIKFSLVATDDRGSFHFYPLALIIYFGKDWHFINSLYLKFGSDVQEFVSKDQVRDVLEGATVSELVPIDFNSEENVLFLAKIFSVESVAVRFGSGKTGPDDRNLTDLEFNGLKTLLLAYRYMHQNNLLTKVPNS